MRLKALCVWSGFAWALCSAAHAACTRTIVVPAAQTGYSVIVKNEVVTGVYPELLVELGRKAGCNFEFPVVPRARLDQMFFKSATADVMIPATRTEERDKAATFVPLIYVQPALISVDGRARHIQSIRQLAATKSLRGGFARGFNYGAQYNELLDALTKDKRLEYAPNLSNVAAMMALHRVDFTILAPTLFYSTVAEDPELKGMTARVSYKPIDGLEQVESGVYLSQTSLGAQDAAELRKLFDEAVRGGLLWKKFQKYYPAEILKSVVTKR